LLITIVTLPAFALRLLVLNLSWLGSALILSADPPPADPALVLVDWVLELDFDEPPPQPAAASAAAARHTAGPHFMG
jgi:hypothetical protein